MSPLVDYVGLIVTPTGSPAIGDVVVRGASGGWTTAQVGSAPVGSVFILGSGGIPQWGSVPSPVVSSLPTAASGNEGTIAVLGGATVNRDLPYMCVKLPAGTYEWDRIPLILSFTVGDGINHLFSLAHYLGHQSPFVTVINNTSHEEENPDVTFPDAQHANVEFGASNIPAANAYTVRING